MTTSSGASTSSALSLCAPASTEAPPPQPKEDSGSFEDAMQRQGAGAAPVSPVAAPNAPPVPVHGAKGGKPNAHQPTLSDVEPTEPAPEDVAAEIVGPAALAPAASKAKAPLVAAGSDLASMIVQATVLASNARQLSVVPAPTGKATPNAGQPGLSAAKDNSSAKTATLPVASDLATLIAQASLLTTGNPAPAAVKTPLATPALDAASIATVLAAGKELPITAPAAAATGLAGKEKKSTGESVKGSFLQPEAESATASSGPATTLVSSLLAAGNASQNQAFGGNSGAKTASASSLVEAAARTAGTANDQKKAVTNLTQDIPNLAAGNAAGASMLKGGTELQIKLASNNDFHDAIQQVIRVAQATQTSESRAPMRVAIEIQTPPGAIVNVYVSKQADSYRAQLSTNDPQALAWVQDKMSSLRETDSGVTVRWLPPQMEAKATITTSNSSHDANLSWDRGGQNQQQQQQADERSQSERTKRAGLLAAATSGRSQFAEAISAIGRAG